MTAYNASRVRELGAELRAARLRVGLKQKQVGERINRHHSQISRWEQGKGLPSEADLGAMLLLYEVIDEEREGFLRLAREATDPDWVSPGVGRRLASLIESEKAARRIVNVEPMIVPGLLQTENYARAIIAGSGATRDQVSQRVEVRLDRQALLLRDDAPEYVAIVGEYALRYPPCDRSVQVGQLRKLLALSERPNVSILVLPLDLDRRYSAAILGPFVLIEPRSGDPVIRQEHLAATTTLTNSRDVRTYQTAVEDIRRQAMNDDDSAAFIGRLRNEMEHER